jgi:hypothetical protein
MGHAYTKNNTASAEWPWFCIKASSQHRPSEARNKNKEKKPMQACLILKCIMQLRKVNFVDKYTSQELPKTHHVYYIMTPSWYWPKLWEQWMDLFLIYFPIRGRTGLEVYWVFSFIENKNFYS